MRIKHKLFKVRLLYNLVKKLGHLDTDLTERGVAQAKNVKSILTDEFNLVISSDLKRAKFTAYEIVNHIQVELDSRLRERNYGSFCGKPRTELQEFSKHNTPSKNGCQGWKEVGAECVHEAAVRTHSFLIDVCNRVSKMNLNSKAEEIPLKCCTEMNHISKFAHDYFTNKMPNSNIEMIYGGNVLLVTHGGWARHLLRLLAFHSQHSHGFPQECTKTVVRNCGVCVIGMAFELNELLDYEQKPIDGRQILKSPIPNFGSTMDHDDHNVQFSCTYSNQANPLLPVVSLCYAYDVTKDDVCKTIVVDRPIAEHVSSRCEPSNLDDEYAGTPN